MVVDWARHGVPDAFEWHTFGALAVASQISVVVVGYHTTALSIPPGGWCLSFGPGPEQSNTLRTDGGFLLAPCPLPKVCRAQIHGLQCPCHGPGIGDGPPRSLPGSCRSSGPARPCSCPCMPAPSPSFQPITRPAAVFTCLGEAEELVTVVRLYVTGGLIHLQHRPQFGCDSALLSLRKRSANLFGADFDI